MNTVAKYKKSFIIGAANSLEYRFDFFIGLVSTVFPIIIQVFLWSAIYGSSESAVLYGYSFPQMMMYVFIAGAVSKFIITGIEYVINDDVHTGGLSKFLVQPISYIPFRLLGVIGQKIASFITMLVVTCIMVIVLSLTMDFVIEPVKALLFIPAIIFAAALNFFMFFTISTSVFWLTEIGKFFESLKIAIMVISGGVFPVEVMGNTFASVMKWLPFVYTTNFPIRVITGAVTVNEILKGLFVQTLWIAVLAAASQALWKKGIKKYTAVGG